MAAATSSVSLRLHLLRSTASSIRPGPLQGALRRPSPSARARWLQLQPTRGLETVVEAEAAALNGDGDGDDVSAAELMMRAARSSRTGGDPNGRPGQPKEGGGGSVNATVLAQRARAPTPPGLPAEGSGGQGGSVH